MNKINSLAIFATLFSLFFSSFSHAFDVYQFINWRYYKSNDGKIQDLDNKAAIFDLNTAAYKAIVGVAKSN